MFASIRYHLPEHTTYTHAYILHCNCTNTFRMCPTRHTVVVSVYINVYTGFIAHANASIAAEYISATGAFLHFM